jgi:hypothetical protein
MGRKVHVIEPKQRIVLKSRFTNVNPFENQARFEVYSFEPTLIFDAVGGLKLNS